MRNSPRTGGTWLPSRLSLPSLLALLLVASSLGPAGPGPLAGVPATTASAAPASDSTTPPRQTFLVYPGQVNALIVAEGSGEDLAERAQAQQRAALAATLQQLQRQGEVGPASFEPTRHAFRVALSAHARQLLATDPQVAQVEPAPASPSPPPVPLFPTTAGSNVSSVNFVQVYSPFLWGHTNVGGLSVQLALLDATGSLTVGVPIQTTSSPLGSIVIDRTQLYYETVFVDPTLPSHPPVVIVPGEQVHVITSGIDPGSGQYEVDDRRIPVDDVQAWTSEQTNTVSGTTSAANASVIVTVGSGSLNLASYLATAQNGVTYAQVSADGQGSFLASQFQVNGAPTPVDLVQGSTGFVRVLHSDGNEVYTVHGQNVFVLENSPIVHGYAFPLPMAPPGLAAGVTVSRPAPTVSVTLRDSQGTQKAAVTVPGGAPYSVVFPTPIVGGDLVQVAINGGPLNQITTNPVTAAGDLGGNQVTGSGPAGTLMTVGVGQIDGYLSQYSTFTYLQAQVTTKGSGAYATGPITCGSTNEVKLQPGSFGFAGYEDPHANFVYADFAVPRVDVMANYPYIEGWVADGTVRPTVTVRDPSGSLLSQATVTPLLLYATTLRLYVNTYYHLTPTQFIGPGDTVTVSGGGQNAMVVVDSFAAYLNPDTDTVVGTAPAGATVKVIPANVRTSSQTAVADGTGSFAAGNPFTSFIDVTCSTTSSTLSFNPGDAGRAYLTHADGNTVFVVWGRSMHVNENENVVELFLYPTLNLDWTDTPSRSPVTTTVTLTPFGGTPVTVQVSPFCLLSCDTQVSLIDSQGQKAVIRAGATLSTSFVEGPPGGPSRTATLSVSGIPLITASPDVTANTVGGVGPANWSGQATFNGSPYPPGVPLPTRSSTVYGPVSFKTSTGNTLDLVNGNSGVVSFGDSAGHRVWVAWAATGVFPHLTGPLRPGDTQVCGTAAPGIGITILDVTVQPQQTVLGAGAAAANGTFCVPVSPPLGRGQVILAQDANGLDSQPSVVGVPIYLPRITNGTTS